MVSDSHLGGKAAVWEGIPITSRTKLSRHMLATTGRGPTTERNFAHSHTMLPAVDCDDDDDDGDDDDDDVSLLLSLLLLSL